MSKAATDNSYFFDKVMLRINHLPEKRQINVLDAFSSTGKIWNEIKSTSEKTINVTRIDIAKRQGVYLKGDNIKFMKMLDLSSFDVIDLDAYGVPFKQLEIIFKSKYQGVVFVTYIQTMFGILPMDMLEKIGYKKQMVRKVKTIFTKYGMEKMKQYIAFNGVKKIWLRSEGKKNYFFFRIE